MSFYFTYSTNIASLPDCTLKKKLKIDTSFLIMDVRKCIKTVARFSHMMGFDSFLCHIANFQFYLRWQAFLKIKIVQVTVIGFQILHDRNSRSKPEYLSDCLLPCQTSSRCPIFPCCRPPRASASAYRSLLARTRPPCRLLISYHSIIFIHI